MIINLTDEQKIKIQNSEDIFNVMQNILLQVNEIDRDREHFWVMGLNNSNKILFIEQISIGTIRATTCEPLEVFSLAIQRRALGIVLVHNHPSGVMRPSENDKKMTDKLIQAGEILSINVVDHLIISTKSYLSFQDSNIIKELSNSKYYVPRYKQEQAIRDEAIEKGIVRGKDLLKKEIVKRCFEENIEISLITKITQLPPATIKRMEKSFNKLNVGK